MFITTRDEGGDNHVPTVPPNTRAPSPDRALPYAETVPPERDRLPYAEPIPSEHKTRAEPWIEASEVTRVLSATGLHCITLFYTHYMYNVY